jgi:site-specific DNA-methyltransferase (adenine-specific)
VLADLRDIDAIITDPPYGKEYLPLLRDLAALADRILKPNGIMAVLYGQTYLPEAFAQMTGFRPYRWTACYLTEGNAYVSHARKVHSNWKPVLIYGGSEHRFGDLFRATGNGPDKEHHEWGQNLEAFQSIIAALTDPGATIVDPFAGGGTTLIAAKSLGRHAIGSEINADAMAFKFTEAA